MKLSKQWVETVEGALIAQLRNVASSAAAYDRVNEALVTFREQASVFLERGESHVGGEIEENETRRRSMPDYKTVPVEAACAIAEQYDKSIVIVITHDPVHGLMHTTTYGTDAQNKAWAAQGGEIVATALGAVLDKSINFEDYRLDQATKLLAALHSAIAIADEAFLAWDNDNESRCGKILRYLGDPRTSGYRADIDLIHETVRNAERFLTSQPLPKDGTAA